LLIVWKYSLPNCECKGTTYFANLQTFLQLFFLLPYIFLQT